MVPVNGTKNSVAAVSGINACVGSAKRVKRRKDMPKNIMPTKPAFPGNPK
jgi:hypothetical protein